MELILLENIRNLGPFGTRVKVAPGYGRNFLIPTGRAVPANTQNIAMFEARRAELESAANERLHAAQKRAATIEGVVVTITARAADEGKLYGSVGTNEIARALSAALASTQITVERHEVRLPNGVIRELGEYEVELALHAEVVAKVKVTVAPE